MQGEFGLKDKEPIKQEVYLTKTRLNEYMCYVFQI